MQWSIPCSVRLSKGPSGTRVRLGASAHIISLCMSALPCVFLWPLCGFQGRATHSTTKTNTTAPSLLWSMIGGWRFTRPQEGRRKTTSPLASSRSVTLALRAVHPTILSIHPFIHPSCEKTTGQMQYTVSPVNLIHHLHVLAALYLHQIQQGPELPRNPLAPDGRLWLCSQPADEENLHGRSFGSTGWEFTLRNVSTNVRLNPLLDLNEGVEDMYDVYWVSYRHSHIYTEQSECYFSFSLKTGTLLHLPHVWKETRRQLWGTQRDNSLLSARQEVSMVKTLIFWRHRFNEETFRVL